MSYRVIYEDDEGSEHEVRLDNATSLIVFSVERDNVAVHGSGVDREELCEILEEVLEDMCGRSLPKNN